MGHVIAFPRRAEPAPAEISNGFGCAGNDDAAAPLAYSGLSRDAEYPEIISVTFSRPLTEAELRLFDDVCRQGGAILEAAGREP